MKDSKNINVKKRGPALLMKKNDYEKALSSAITTKEVPSSANNNNS